MGNGNVEMKKFDMKENRVGKETKCNNENEKWIEGSWKWQAI
jgi:hypothetical protein